MQLKFKHVCLLVIDEKSMIGQKQLFYVHKRLQEERPDKGNEPFGGLSIVLLGDWKQLPPVLDSPLYQDPSELQGRTDAARQKEGEKNAESVGHQFKAQAYLLYRKFDKCIIFTNIQRQEGDNQAEFCSEFKHLGEGEFSVADWNRWQCRTLDTLPTVEKAAFLKHGTLACALKKDMVNHNQSKVRELQQPIALIKAVNNQKAEGNKEGDEGGLPTTLSSAREQSLD
jgi:ATP-dependent DNA helicase PIF1